jgi:phosphoribosyl 1,2-cyclic phosphodiesterase
MIVERVRLANVLVLEANYDRQLLQDDTRRPWSTKQRIMSRHGHLSNEGAAEVAEQIATANLRHIFLGHLSLDCNDPDVAHRTVSERLTRAGITHVNIQTASQKEPLPTLTMEMTIPHE